MQYPKSQKNFMRIKYLLPVFLLLGFFNCRVSLVPPYDASIEEAIVKTAKLNDALYLKMQELIEADRKYELYSLRYMDIEL